MKRCSLWCMCSFQFLTHLFRNKGQKSKRYKILRLCINLKFITSQQIVTAWHFPVTKPFTSSACFFINPGSIPKLGCSTHAPAQRPGNSWKIYFMEKDCRNCTEGRIAFPVLFYFSKCRRGEMKILSYCVSALPQPTLGFNLKKLWWWRTPKGNGKGRQGIGRAKANKAFGHNG